MIKSSISADMLGLSLRQMGANIQVNSSKILFVEFKISEKLTVSYFCNIRDEDQVYLQRIEPYPVRNFRFEEVENILKFIKNDVTLFANASQSSNFPLFLDIIDANYYVRKEIEHLFLLKNVPHGLLEDLLKKNNDILEQIKNSKHLISLRESFHTQMKNIMKSSTNTPLKALLMNMPAHTK